jgi:Carbohydrate binding module (family 6)
MKRYLIALAGISLISYGFIQKSLYSGHPYKNQMQQIPGKIECEFYDEGGEGIAYHDADSINNGSGKLNPPNGTFLNEFRMKEGVDISYTKTHNIDDNPYNKVLRSMDKLYVGWTVPGEWINYTVNVNEPATYKIGVLYTANGDGLISMDSDGKDATGPLKIASTHDDRDTVKWRQWHHWNSADSIGSITLNKGVHVLKLHIVANGNMNFDYLDFKKAAK